MQEGWDSMANAFQEMIQQEELSSGGLLVDTREVMIKVSQIRFCGCSNRSRSLCE